MRKKERCLYLGQVWFFGTTKERKNTKINDHFLMFDCQMNHEEN